MSATVLLVGSGLAAGPLPLFAEPLDGVAWVVWQKKRFDASDPPTRLDEWAVRTVNDWAPFAIEHDYELFLTDDARVLLVVSGKKLQREVDRATETLDTLDELIPAPSEKPRYKAIPAGADPETVSDGDPLGVVTMTLVRAEDKKDMEAVARHLAKIAPYLSGWANQGGYNLTAYFHQRPLMAAWIKHPEGLEESEWDTENELIHRLTHLYRLREYGQQPNWLSMGLAWYIEEEARSAIYCMPYRASFVPREEHKSWERDLRKLFKGRKEALTVEELSRLQAGEYDHSAALEAWGAVRFLAEFRPKALAPVLADLRALWETKGVHTNADGSWYRVEGFEVSAEDQLAVLKRHAGDDVLEEMARFMEKGRTYRP